MTRIAFLGLMMALGSMLVYQVVLRAAMDAGDSLEQAVPGARTAAFCTIVSFQLLLAFSARSEEESLLSLGPFSNRMLVLAVAASFLMQLVVVYVPGVNDAFGTVALTAQEWALVLMVGLSGLVANEAWKYFSMRRSPREKGTGAGA
jgi:Ca2+-transporting ATPase